MLFYGEANVGRNSTFIVHCKFAVYFFPSFSLSTNWIWRSGAHAGSSSDGLMFLLLIKTSSRAIGWERSISCRHSKSTVKLSGSAGYRRSSTWAINFHLTSFDAAKPAFLKTCFYHRSLLVSRNVSFNRLHMNNDHKKNLHTCSWTLVRQRVGDKLDNHITPLNYSWKTIFHFYDAQICSPSLPISRTKGFISQFSYSKRKGKICDIKIRMRWGFICILNYLSAQKKGSF